MDYASFFIALSIFLVTLFLVLKRPRNLGIGYSAMAGGAVSLLAGVTTFHDIFVVWNIVWNATFTFVAVIILTLIFDEAGFFEYWASRIALAAKGNTRRLFLLTIILGASISAFFANDGCALVLTPIVVSMVRKTGMKKQSLLPFIMAAGFIADTASLPFVVSNLVNIVTAGYFGIPFLGYAGIMVLPDLSSILFSAAVLWLYFRKDISRVYDTSAVGNPLSSVKDSLLSHIAIPVIIVLVAAYSVSGFYSIPVAFVAVPAAAVVLAAASVRKRIDTRRVLKSAPWQIVLFSIGMYMIVFGLGREGLTSMLSSALSALKPLPGPFGIISAGLLFAFTAAIMNNMPSVMLGNLAIGSMRGAASRQLIYANVIGNDIGPKFTPIGSLATLLWLHTLERKESVKIGAGRYMRMGIILALPVLVVSLAVVWIVLSL